MLMKKSSRIKMTDTKKTKSAKKTKKTPKKSVSFTEEDPEICYVNPAMFIKRKKNTNITPEQEEFAFDRRREKITKDCYIIRKREIENRIRNENYQTWYDSIYKKQLERKHRRKNKNKNILNRIETKVLWELFENKKEERQYDISSDSDSDSPPNTSTTTTTTTTTASSTNDILARARLDWIQYQRLKNE